MNDTFQKSVGLALKLARQRSGLTQDQVAKKTGIQKPNISAIENGKFNLTLETISKISEAVGMEPEFHLTPSHETAS